MERRSTVDGRTVAARHPGRCDRYVTNIPCGLLLHDLDGADWAGAVPGGPAESRAPLRRAQPYPAAGAWQTTTCSWRGHAPVRLGRALRMRVAVRFVAVRAGAGGGGNPPAHVEPA